MGQGTAVDKGKRRGDLCSLKLDRLRFKAAVKGDGGGQYPGGGRGRGESKDEGNKKGLRLRIVR